MANTEMMKLLTLASTWNIQLTPYVRNTNVGLAASLQFFATLPPFPDRRYPSENYFEVDRSPHPFRESVIQEKLLIKDGHIAIPQKPGLGITLDWDIIKKFQVAF